MSDFVRTLNLIKENRNYEWLTPSQYEAFIAIQKSLAAPGTVNLCGKAGVGKTFLTWVLADTLNYTYFPHLEYFWCEIDIKLPGVIIDNASPFRQMHRDILKALQFRDVNNAVLVTRELIRDYTHYVELSISSEDKERVLDNLSTIGYATSDPQGHNFWYLVNPSLRRF